MIPAKPASKPGRFDIGSGRRFSSALRFGIANCGYNDFGPETCAILAHAPELSPSEPAWTI